VRRRSTWVAWALVAVWTASVVALCALSVANGTFAPDAFTDSVAWLAGTATGAFSALAALQPTLQIDDQVVANPVAVPTVENPEGSVVGAVLLAVIVLAALLSVVSLVVRFRRSRGEERLQLKWFTYAGLLLTP
jgi:amino acid transporter